MYSDLSKLGKFVPKTLYIRHIWWFIFMYKIYLDYLKYKIYFYAWRTDGNTFLWIKVKWFYSMYLNEWITDMVTQKWENIAKNLKCMKVCFIG